MLRIPDCVVPGLQYDPDLRAYYEGDPRSYDNKPMELLEGDMVSSGSPGACL